MAQPIDVFVLQDAQNCYVKKQSEIEKFLNMMVDVDIQKRKKYKES